MESERSVRQEGFDRLKKIIEDAGFSSDSPTPPLVDLLKAIADGDNAEKLVDLAVWRLEQEDLIGHRLGHDDIVLFVNAILAIVSNAERVAIERKA